MGRVGLMKPYMRPIYPGALVSGTAVTVLLHPGDNWMMHVAAAEIEPGDIVVAALTSDCSDGYFGDLLGTSFMARGAKGLVIDAGVRDVKTLTEMGFPVWSKCVSAKGTVKATWARSIFRSSARAPRSIRATRSSPTMTGWSSCRPNGRPETAEAAKAREANESDKRAKLAAGVLGLDMYKCVSRSKRRA